jgi:MFS family permease
MGVGGALMWPAILGLTYSLLPPAKKGLAGGLILGVAGLGNTVGPLLGGWLTDVATWRLVFFINLPVTGFAMLVTRRRVPESRIDAAEHGIDYSGVALLSAGAIAILIGLDLANADGFTSPLILALLAGGVALLAVFLLAERRLGERALVPADVLRNRVFAASCATVLLMSAIFFSALLYLPQFMEEVLHYSAIRSGAGLLPLMGVFAVTSFVAGSLYGRLGPRVTVSAGAALLAAGIFLLSFSAGGSAYLPLVPGMCVVGVGVGLFYSAVTTAAVTALDPARSSLAGGIVYMCQIAGGAIGLGLNTAIVLSAATLSHGITIASGLTPGWPWPGSRSRSGSCAARGRRPRTPWPRRPITGCGPDRGARSRPPVTAGRTWRGGPGGAGQAGRRRPGQARNCHYVRPGTAGRRARIGRQAPVVPATRNEET